MTVQYSRFGWEPPANWSADRATELTKCWRPKLQKVAADACRRLTEIRTEAGRWTVTLATTRDFLIIEHACLISGATGASIRDALKFIPKDSADHLSDLTSLICARIADTKKSRRDEQFLFVLPLRIQIPPNLSPACLPSRGRPFWVCEQKHQAALIERILDSNNMPPFPDVIDSRSGANLYVGCQSTVIVQAQGTATSDAWAQIDDDWSLLRGAIELSAGAFTRRLVVRGRDPVPPAKIQSPAGTFVWLPSEKWEHEWFSYSYALLSNASRNWQITERNIEQAQWLLQETSNESSRVHQLIGACLTLYGIALVQPFDYAQLLHLWQCAERLVFPCDTDRQEAESTKFRRGDTSTVCMRLASIVKECDPQLCDVECALQAIAALRNDIVHRGDHKRLTQEHVGYLKFMVDHALMWAVRHYEKFPSLRHIDCALSHLSRPNVAETAREVDSVLDGIRAAGVRGQAL